MAVESPFVVPARHMAVHVSRDSRQRKDVGHVTAKKSMCTQSGVAR